MVPSLLVLTDFFQPANRALAYAVTLAGGLGASLVLLHVHRDSVLDPELLTGELATLDTEAENRAFASLVRDLAVPAIAEIGHGRVAEAVAAAVRRHQPMLLVLGRPDTEELPDELVTTTALELLRAAPCPMLVVPPTVRHAPVPRRVLLAVDGEPFSLGSYAGTMRHLLDTLGAELTVLHVEAHPGPAATTAAALASVQRTGLVADLASPVRTRSLHAPHPAAAILKAAQPAEFDLVILIARPRSFWGELFHRSVTAQVLLHSAVPVLLLPAQE
ncbi:universal stress protein [Hymenobacter sp. UYCo722]|uniref:universal stress protein n=1 Tax=Hymenobacter sp. UYCo722 TaxID=3156335 RepID=UPI003394099B